MKVILTEAQYNKLYSEGIAISQDNKVSIDTKNNSLIDTSLGKSSKNLKFQARKTTLPLSRVLVYSVYQKETGPAVTNVLKAFKGKSDDLSMDNDQYDSFINRTAIFFAKELSKIPFDTVICMQSSSPLVKNVAEKTLGKISNRSVKYLPDAIKKSIEDLQFNKPTSMSDAQANAMQKYVDKAKSLGNFEIKKIPAQNRKFFSGFITIPEQITRSIVGKDVVIFDDYLTSGATLDSLCVAMLEMNPKSITCFTILK